MEILNKKILLASIFSLFCTTTLLGQDTSLFRKKIVQELALLDNYFDNRLFVNKSEDIDSNNIQINRFEEVMLSNSFGKSSYCQLAIVNVSLKGLISSSIRDADSLTYEYILIKYHNDYIRLFGFLTSDINRLQVDFFHQADFKELLENISITLISKNVLNKKQASLFMNSVLRKNSFYPSRLGKSVNILNNDLGKNISYQTNILPYQMIKPMLVN